MIRTTGKCCCGDLCNHPTHQLVAGEHHCAGCGGIYHALCAQWVSQPTEENPFDGKYVCLKCISHPSVPPTTEENDKEAVKCIPHPSAPPTTEDKDTEAAIEALALLSSSSSCPPATTNPSAVVICNACGCEGHRNSNTKKCELFKGRKRRNNKDTNVKK